MLKEKNDTFKKRIQKWEETKNEIYENINEWISENQEYLEQYQAKTNKIKEFK